jgi:hypothetical protein
MKITMYKHDMTRICHESEQELLEAAGWRLQKTQAGEEVIRLKPTVKSRATVTAPEEANIDKGDE